MLLQQGAGGRWQTEVFVLRGDDRADLRRQVGTLADYLDRNPQVAMLDLASSLGAQLSPGGKRLAVVAGSGAELHARLERAAGRLADPQCRRINDTQGIYFSEDPLYHQGSLGLLFPGEGAQYLNMLGDLLPHFPEVGEHFERCDRTSLEAGRRSQPLSRSIFLSDDAPADRRESAEAELARLDNAAAGVLVANWALYGLLWNLGLRGSATTGHSSGEISALAAAGCIEPDDHLFAELFALGNVLQREENEGRMADAALLAVGAGGRKVAGLIEAAGGELYLAMDNCPHQTVVGGRRAAIERLEHRLQAEAILCERLPFNRPYHTPLFRPHLAPLERMYEAIDFQRPRLAVYSCATGGRMPDDPADIRRLAVSQWACRVEFARIVQSMYEDGIRLFVEVGPRGNLTSFVEDVLRGRPFVAVASNVQRRPGVSQINHLVGQLAAHHVPLALDYLYRRRDPQPIDWRPSGNGQQVGQTAVRRPSPEREAVLRRHFQVMEEFLKLQQDVHQRFLGCLNHKGATGSLSASAEPENIASGTGWQAASGTPAGAPPSGRTMIGEIVDHRPGRALVMRRRIDLDEDLYARDHTLGGRDASAVDPQHHGLPVMPMALNLEMMAEVASVLVPGRLVVGFRRVRLQRWIPLYEDPVTLEVRARVLPPSVPLGVADAISEVVLEIHDLGNDRQPGGAETPAVEGTVTLADRYPSPPQIDDFPLTNQRPCRMGPDEFYRTERRLFHGPVFQAVCANDRIGDGGIEGRLETLSHAGLFASTPRPGLLLDPILIDASTHILGSWHLSQEDRAGRVVFPYELGSVQFFGPRPAEGSRLKCRVQIEQLSRRQVSHRIDLITPDGKLWCRLQPAEYWRFYWPAECVDFFRHHDRYLVSRDLPAALPAKPVAGNGRAAPAVPASVRWLLADRSPDVVQPVIRAALARVALSRREWRQFYEMKGPQQRLTEWLFGRMAAKDCVRALWQRLHGRRLFPADMEIDTDEHGRPLVRLLGEAAAELPRISIAHSGGVVAAMAAFARRVGIDLEPVLPRDAKFERTAFDRRERELLDRFGGDRDEAIARFWCAKEAVAKALGRGLVEGPGTVAVRQVDPQSGTLRLALGTQLKSLFPDLQSALLVAWTSRQEEIVVATTFAETGAAG